MKLSDSFWKEYDLDLQEVKVAYLNWALNHAKEPSPRHRHLFLWSDQERFCIVNSRYRRAFSASPFGLVVRGGVPRPRIEGEPLGIDRTDIDLKNRLSVNTTIIREAIKGFLYRGDIESAREAVLNFNWLKLGAHELFFDRVQYTKTIDLDKVII
jgi:hypothetical protein